MRSRTLNTSALLNKLIEIELAAGVEEPASIRRMALEAQEILLGIQCSAVARLRAESYSPRVPAQQPKDSAKREGQ